MIKHSAFFGDAQREFALNPKLIAELERVTGAGIGGLSKRFFAGEFKSSELTEILRLSLIGGDTDAEEAAALVAVYCIPVMPAYGLAVAILEKLMFGEKTDA